MREYTFGYVRRYPRQAPPQVRSVLAKLELCRTKALAGRTYKCPRCQHECQVYNSCTDRHCPLCSGAKRADWMDKTAQLLLPKIPYFQVVFTLPESLSRFTLGNRRQMYGLLFRSAWAALEERLREEQGIEPAALMVLHTWNQELDHHPHLHAVVPGGGPSLKGKRWRYTRHPWHRRRRKRYLVDNRELSRRFRDKFIAGMKRLHRRGEFQFGPGSLVRDYKDFVAWVERVADQDWCVYIQPPPADAPDPRQVLKYLARYLTGGPISDRRLISHENQEVTFWARSKDKQAGNPSRPFSLPGSEFIRRWAMHILPKGFTKSRQYGGFSSRLRRHYLDRCRALLDSSASEPTQPPDREAEGSSETAPKCPHCSVPLECIQTKRRPSWRDIFDTHATCPVWYGPSLPSVWRFHPRPREPDG